MHLFAKKCVFAGPNSFASSSMMEVSELSEHAKSVKQDQQNSCRNYPAKGKDKCGPMALPAAAKTTLILELNPLVFVVCSLIVLFYSVCYDNFACKVTKKT